MGFISRITLKALGWRAENLLTEPIDKFILISAPHTSFWDFVYGRISLSALGIKGQFLIKKEAFRFPYKRLLMWIGGVPVDRGQGSNVIKPIVDIIHNSKKFCLVITPEGTRKKTSNWKKGYYFIAQTAGIPVVLGFIDYREKVCSITKVLDATGDYDEDFKKIQEFYRGRVAKYPKNFNLS